MPSPSMGPKWFWTIQIILVDYQLFWMSPICYGWVQIILNRSKLRNCSRKFGHDQNNLYLSKTIWTVNNNFEPIEGQGIHIVYELSKSQSMSKTGVKTSVTFFPLSSPYNPIFVSNYSGCSVLILCLAVTARPQPVLGADKCPSDAPQTSPPPASPGSGEAESGETQMMQSWLNTSGRAGTGIANNILIEQENRVGCKSQ